MASTPVQPIEDIEKEVVGDQDDDDEGEAAAVPRERVRQVGALNAEAVQTNRRRKTILERKRDGEKNVPWGEGDACLLYDDIISLYPPHQLLCCVKRLTGTQTSWYLTGVPRHGQELYEAIRKQCHGQSPETEYLVVFRDRVGREERGRGRVILPSTEFDAVVAPATGVPREVAASVAPPPAPAPMPPMAPPIASPSPMNPGYATDPAVVMSIQRQLSEIAAQNQALREDNQALRAQIASGQAPARQPMPNAPPPVVVMPSPQAQYQPPPPPPPPPPAPAPAPAKVPQVPPGYALTMMGEMPVLVPLQSLGLAGPPVAGAPAQPAAAPATPAAAPAAPPSPFEQFTSTVGIVRGAMQAVREINSLLPAAPAPQPVAAAEPVEKEEDDSPTEIKRVGDVNVVQNKDDGSVRLLDTAIANAPAILGWLDKQKNEILARQNGQAPPQQQQMPPGQIGSPIIPQQ